MQEKKLDFPIIAKPERGVIGIGIQKIHNDKALQQLLEKIPQIYILQEYADLPIEFGINVQKVPGKPLRVVGLTQKIIPHVLGDGKSTVRELIIESPSLHHNKKALLTHSTRLEHIPKKGERYPTLVQASHTYGTLFVNKQHLITPELEKWIAQLCAENKELYAGRFDMRLPSLSSLFTGVGAKIIEMNGVTGEPIQMYDDRHSLGFAIKTLYQFYDKSFRIAKMQKKKKTNTKHILSRYKTYLKDMKELKQLMG
jgi:hypothetical protein